MTLDSALLQWTDPLVRELRDRLRAAFPTPQEAYELLSTVEGWPEEFLHWSGEAGSNVMWQRILSRAADAGLVRRLVTTALTHPGKEGHRDRLSEIMEALDSAEQDRASAQPPLALVTSDEAPNQVGMDTRTADLSDWTSIISRRCHNSLTAIVPAVVADPEMAACAMAEATKDLRGLDVVVQQLLTAAESASDPALFARLHQLAEELRKDREVAVSTFQRLRQGTGGRTASDLCDFLSRHADKLVERLKSANSLLM